MTEMTYFVVTPYVEAMKRGRVVPGEPQEMPNEGAAVRRLKMVEDGLFPAVVGALAFKRTGDPETGDWRDAELIDHVGWVPPEVLDPAHVDWD